MNKITLFSNGMGHFYREYDIPKKGRQISIPFKSDYMGDVAASLQIFGDGIQIVSPPSYAPSDSQSSSLELDREKSMRSLLSQLAGSKVTLVVKATNSPSSGQLLGIDSSSQHIGDKIVVKEDFVVIEKDGTLRRYALSTIDHIKFDDESVQSEINKAIKTAFQEIKPGSTLMEVELASKNGEDSKCFLQYTIPVAAWKMRYSIHQTVKDKDGAFYLEGSAIIDNNTDEDWKDFHVSVVTGNPISFQTDLANVVVPRRKMVHLVDGSALSNVDVEEGVAVLCAAAPVGRGIRSAAMKSMTNTASFGLEAMQTPPYSPDALAEAPGMESKDVGDFCVFSGKETVTILAHRSSVVSMFNERLKSAGVVLLYKAENNPDRAYRAIKFKNETNYSLSKGKTVIYNEGIFSGECVLETTKPKENRTLPHCLENGVKIVKGNTHSQNNATSIKLSEGLSVVEFTSIASTKYTIKNRKSEAFKMVFEHQCAFGENSKIKFDGVDTKELERVPSSTHRGSCRAYFDLEPDQEISFSVIEVDVVSNTHQFDFGWINSQVIQQNNPLKDDRSVQACVDAKKKCDAKQFEITELEKKCLTIDKQVERLRSNLLAVKDVSAIGDQITKWASEMNTLTAEVNKSESTTLPKLRDELESLKADLSKKLQSVTASWKLQDEKPKAVAKSR